MKYRHSMDKKSLDIKKENDKRVSRKIGEKLRRERLNKHFIALSEENPWTSDIDRRLDKSQILKLTVNFLKLHHGLKQKKSIGFRQGVVKNDTLTRYLHEVNGGFLIVLSTEGNVVFVSKNITELLGHDMINLIGCPVYNIIHKEDHDILSAQLEFQDTPMTTCKGDLQQHKISSMSSYRDGQCSFVIRIQNLKENKDGSEYVPVRMLGHLKNKGNSNSGTNDTFLSAVGKPINFNTIRELSLMDIDKLEFCSQHGMDGYIWFTDHRVAQCLGNMPAENIGQSCYTFINPADLKAVSVSHMKILKEGEAPPTYFRLHPPNGLTVFLESRSVIVRDMITKKPKFISSVNIVISEDVGLKMLEEQKKKVEALTDLTDDLSLDDNDGESDVHITENNVPKEMLQSSTPCHEKSNPTKKTDNSLLKSLLLTYDSSTPLGTADICCEETSSVNKNDSYVENHSPSNSSLYREGLSPSSFQSHSPYVPSSVQGYSPSASSSFKNYSSSEPDSSLFQEQCPSNASSLHDYSQCNSSPLHNCSLSNNPSIQGFSPTETSPLQCYSATLINNTYSGTSLPITSPTSTSLSNNSPSSTTLSNNSPSSTTLSNNSPPGATFLNNNTPETSSVQNYNSSNTSYPNYSPLSTTSVDNFPLSTKCCSIGTLFPSDRLPSTSTNHTPSCITFPPHYSSANSPTSTTLLSKPSEVTQHSYSPTNTTLHSYSQPSESMFGSSVPAPTSNLSTDSGNSSESWCSSNLSLPSCKGLSSEGTCCTQGQSALFNGNSWGSSSRMDEVGDSIHSKFSHQLQVKHDNLEKFLQQQELDLTQIQDNFNQVNGVNRNSYYSNLSQKLVSLQDLVNIQKETLVELRKQHNETVNRSK